MRTWSGPGLGLGLALTLSLTLTLALTSEVGGQGEAHLAGPDHLVVGLALELG